MSEATPIPLHRRLRLRHLELLATLGEMPSLHRAAAHMGMTQPAASRLLLEAEQAVGMPLFGRTQRGLVALPAGAALVLRARRTLALLDGSRDELQAIQAGGLGLVRAGVSAVAAALLVPRAVAWLRDAGVSLRVCIEEASPGALLAGLRDGVFDCAISRVLDSDDVTGLLATPLYDEPAVVVARPGHALLGGGHVDWPAAVACEWVLPPQPAPLRRRFLSWLASQRMAPPVCRFESVSVLGNITVVRDSDALAFLPGDVARQYAALGLVAIVPITFPYRLPPVSLLRRVEDEDDASLSALREALEEVRTAAI